MRSFDAFCSWDRLALTCINQFNMPSKRLAISFHYPLTSPIVEKARQEGIEIISPPDDSRDHEWVLDNVVDCEALVWQARQTSYTSEVLAGKGAL